MGARLGGNQRKPVVAGTPDVGRKAAMTYNRHSIWPVMFCVNDVGGQTSTLVQGNTRSFYIPPDITTADKLRVSFFAYTNASSTDTKAVVKIGNSEDPDGDATDGISQFTDFASAVAATTTASVGASSIANGVAYEQVITCTANMVTHAGNGDGFQLCIGSSDSNYVYAYAIRIDLEYA